MKSFDELKKERILTENNRLNVAKKRLVTSNGVARTIRQKEQIDYSLSVLDNIDETVKMEISYNANLLFDLISTETQYTIFVKVFYSRFMEYIRAIEREEVDLEKFDKHVIDLIKYFDFTRNDILKLVEFGNVESLKDEYIKFINEFYGTNIPELFEWIIIDDESRDVMSDEELTYLDIYDINLQFRNGDFMINKFNLMYPMLFESDMENFFGDYLFRVNGSRTIRRLK